MIFLVILIWRVTLSEEIMKYLVMQIYISKLVSYGFFTYLESSSKTTKKFAVSIFSEELILSLNLRSLIISYLPYITFISHSLPI